MASGSRKVFACSCENTMPLDTAAIAKGCRDGTLETANHLCRSEIERFRKAVAAGDPITVGCTQEATLFSEISDEAGLNVSLVNIREDAGWSADAKNAGPKMAALLAAAAEPLPETPLVTLNSDGVILIYGHDERAIEAAHLLKDRLDVTVLLSKPRDIAPPQVTEFPVAQGMVRNAKGYLGAFELTVDQYALPSPSSRGMLEFGSARDGAVSHCDLILDVSGDAPLFPAADLRDGYLRADPGSPAEVLRAALQAYALIGTFDKPRYIAFTENLCTYSRSRIVGCHRCLDLCPTGAISPNGDHVWIDENICAGCGACAAVCPTGAATYALPTADALMRKLRTLYTAYREAGGVKSVLLVHDMAHGSELISALARHGDGLPSNVIPIAVNEVTQTGIEFAAAAFAYGASALRFLTREKPRHDMTSLAQTVELMQAVLIGLGFDESCIGVIETDDPDRLAQDLHDIEAREWLKKPASFTPVGGTREMKLLALRELQRAAPIAADYIALPKGAPFGKVEINIEGCTLCLACVSACPTSALGDNPDKPALTFSEAACVQCGLCQATCPEKVISLVPQIDFGAITAPTRILKEEEPFHCVSCGKPFGTGSTINRIIAKLENQHWMFKNMPERLNTLRMCDDCRVIAVTSQSFDPHDAPPRPKVRTTDDYIREREKQEPEA
jgi:ferredoxin